MGAGENRDLRADSVAIRLGSFDSNSEPVICVRCEIHKQQRLVVHVVYDGGESSFIPEIGDSQATARLWISTAGATLLAEVFELPIALVPIEQPRLAIRGSKVIDIHLR